MAEGELRHDLRHFNVDSRSAERLSLWEGRLHWAETKQKNEAENRRLM